MCMKIAVDLREHPTHKEVVLSGLICKVKRIKIAKNRFSEVKLYDIYRGGLASRISRFLKTWHSKLFTWVFSTNKRYTQNKCGKFTNNIKGKVDNREKQFVKQERKTRKSHTHTNAPWKYNDQCIRFSLAISFIWLSTNHRFLITTSSKVHNNIAYPGQPGTTEQHSCQNADTIEHSLNDCVISF